MKQIAQDINNIVTEWIDQGYLKADNIFVIGCSTSEVAGEQIGTSGSDDIAKELYEGFASLKQQTKIHLAFQGCEHINRSLVIERSTLEKFNLDEVNVMPVPSAGGSMASYAYQHM